MNTRYLLRNGLVALTILSLPVGTAGLAFAHSEGAQAQQDESAKKEAHKHHRKAGKGMGGLTHLEARNMAVSAIVELSGQTAETVRQQLETDGFRKTVEAYGITREQMMQAMRPRVLTLIEQARDSGRITAEQADRLIQEVNKGPEAREEGKHRRGGALGQLARVQGANMLADTIAQLTGTPVEEVKARIEDEGFKKAIKSYDLDKQALRDGMKTRMKQAVSEARDEGRITAEQADTLLERIDTWKSKRHG